MGYGHDLVRLVDMKRRAGQSMAPNFKGRQRTTRTPEFLEEICHIFKEKPEQNYRETARELGVCDRIVRQSAKELGFKSYKHRHRALLTKQTKLKRLERCEELLVWLQTPANQSTVIIFSGIYPIDWSLILIQGSPVNMTPLGIGKSVIQTECHINRWFLVL